MWQVWLIISGAFLIFEIITIGFLVFWFAVGALLAMIVSFFVDNIIIQTSVFVVSSALLLFLTRPVVNKFTQKNAEQTNAFSIIGKKGIVIKEIDPLTGSGQIKVDSEVWSSKVEGNSDSKVPVGTEVEVTSIDGVKAIVRY